MKDLCAQFTVRIGRDDSQRAQVIRRTLTEPVFEPYARSLRLLDQQLEMRPSEVTTRVPRKESVGQSHEIDNGDNQQDAEPEPKNEVDLLDEDVDHQNALDGVRMRMAEFTDAKIAQGNVREESTLRNRSRLPCVEHDVKAVVEIVDVVVAEKVLEENHLREKIADVETFDEHVEIGERCACSTKPAAPPRLDVIGVPLQVVGDVIDDRA